jgi:hypothetical protein
MTKRHWFRACFLVASFSLAAAIEPRTVQAGPTVYVADSGENFGTINLTTGVFRPIGTFPLQGADAIFGMGFGSDGKLYGVDSQQDAHLYQIDTTNAHLVDLGPIGMSAIGATTDASGKFYLLSNNPGNSVFFTMDPPSLTTDVVGPTGIPGAGLAAVTANGSQFFMTTGTIASTTYALASVNIATGVATVIGDTGFLPDVGLFVNGTLYGFDFNNAIVTINTKTGAGTQVATYSQPGGQSIVAAAVVVPEPSSLILGLVLAVLTLGLGTRTFRLSLASASR